MRNERPELKVWQTLQQSEEALSATEIHERASMNYKTVKGVLQSLLKMGKIEKLETSGTAYYTAIKEVEA